MVKYVVFDINGKNHEIHADSFDITTHGALVFYKDGNPVWAINSERWVDITTVNEPEGQRAE